MLTNNILQKYKFTIYIEKKKPISGNILDSIFWYIQYSSIYNILDSISKEGRASNDGSIEYTRIKGPKATGTSEVRRYSYSCLVFGIAGGGGGGKDRCAHRGFANQTFARIARMVSAQNIRSKPNNHAKPAFKYRIEIRNITSQYGEKQYAKPTLIYTTNLI